MAPPKDQDALLQQFREELVQEDLLHDGDSIGIDDNTLLRFLRARQFNVRNAKLMWKNCSEWRQNAEGVGIDELYRRIDPFDYPERDHVFNFWPLFFHKTDKKGRPLNIHHFGRINTIELYKHISPERFWQAFLVNAESLTREVLPASTCAAGKHIDGTFVIVDLKGFGTSQFWQMKHLARGAFQVSQDYFPETMAQLAIVNAPTSFTAIWSVMKPWLAKETVAKVSVLGSNYQHALLELIEPENLPTSLGGTCTCSDCVTEEPDEKEKGGVAEMGRCAFSSAGPWMVGRKERREEWLRGERGIALEEGELEKFAAAAATPNPTQEKPASAHSSEDGRAPVGVAAAGADAAESEGASEQSKDEDSSEDSSPGPGTPGPEDALQEPPVNQIVIGDDTKNVATRRDSSVDLVMEKHPETTQVQTADLYAEAQA